LYLQWSLFNAQDYGSVKEAQLKAFAAQSGIAAQRQKEQSEKLYLFELEKTLIRNLQLIKDSQTLMSEQVQVTEKLFRNGSVNALQFVEVLNRKADLILAETETHKQLLEVSSLRAQKQQLPILDQEMTVTSGGLNEKQ
jgi:plasmid maintenance system killer protein